MRIILLGKDGQLGWEFQHTLSTVGELYSFDYPEVDFSQVDTLRGLIQKIRPDLIVNAAAYTAVDRAESEPGLCQLINTQAPAVLASEALAMHSALIHFSTEYVFDGEKGDAYVENDAPNPLNSYGRFKLEGERLIQAIGGAYWIFRSSWIYGMRRDNFVTKVLQWGRKQKSLKIADDQVGSPTWCRLLAEITTQALVMGKQDPVRWITDTAGIYHLAGSGRASRLEWARAILELNPNKDELVVEEILPAKTSEFITPARRPLFAPLDCSRFETTFHLQLPDWRTSLRLMFG